MADVGCVLVARVVAKRLGYEVEDLFSASRAGGVARARQLAMAVARATLERSYPELGRAFGRDHTTVIAAVRAVEARVEKSTEEAVRFLRLKRDATRALDAEFGAREGASESAA